MILPHDGFWNAGNANPCFIELSETQAALIAEAPAPALGHRNGTCEKGGPDSFYQANIIRLELQRLLYGWLHIPEPAVGMDAGMRLRIT